MVVLVVTEFKIFIELAPMCIMQEAVVDQDIQTPEELEDKVVVEQDIQTPEEPEVRAAEVLDVPPRL